MQKEKLEFLTAKARKLRDDAIEIIGHFGVGHIGGAMSVMDALTVIYYDKANVDPSNPKKQDRDRVIMSKGHAGPAMYAVLADLGYYPKEWMTTLNRNGTNLPSHCDMNKTPGIDMTAGSLGQGLSAAVGMAIAAKIDRNPATIYCFIGDGESQEGQIWEATMLAAAKKLDNLIVLLDYNKMQLDGPVASIKARARGGQVEGVQLFRAAGQRPRHRGDFRRNRRGKGAEGQAVHDSARHDQGLRRFLHPGRCELPQHVRARRGVEKRDGEVLI